MAVPHDLNAENAVLGDMLTLPHLIGEVAEQVTPGDFYRPTAGAAFAALVEAHRLGEPLDLVSLASTLREAGIEPDLRWLHELVGHSTSAWRRHARTVVDHRVRRQLVAAIGDVMADAGNPAVDVSDVLDRLQAHVAAIHIPDGKPPAGLHLLDEFIDQPEHTQAPWVVPGLLRAGWRVVVVGGEGGGKSTLWRQFAVLAAQGIHPLGFADIPPVRTLLVDLENPADAITEACRPLRAQVQRRQTYRPGQAWLWHRPQGIDLRTRQGRSELASVCAAVKPDLVSLGPLYKAYQRGKDSDEEAAAEVQHVLDDLRTRNSFALLLEHHAPQDSGGLRNMRPYGSSLWLRWPEIGIGMKELKDQPGVVELDRWRGDRLRNNWPERIARDGVWPWAGVWNNPDDRTTLP